MNEGGVLEGLKVWRSSNTSISLVVKKCESAVNSERIKRERYVREH
jgi:hypothetical protein